MRAVFCVFLSLWLSGCYAYVPATPGAPGAASEVRAYLGAPTPVEVDELVVQSAVRVEGEVVRWTDEALVLSASELTSAAGQRFVGGGQTVRLPRDRIAQVEVKRISRTRSALLAGGIVLLAVAAGSLLGGGEIWGDGGDGGTGGPPK